MTREEVRKRNSSRGGTLAQANKWRSLCVCGHSKLAHKRKAHPKNKQTGVCKAPVHSGGVWPHDKEECSCQEFRATPTT